MKLIFKIGQRLFFFSFISDTIEALAFNVFFCLLKLYKFIVKQDQAAWISFLWLIISVEESKKLMINSNYKELSVDTFFRLIIWSVLSCPSSVTM